MSTQCLNIPTSQSDVSFWIAWHRALKKCVGSNKANSLWTDAWGRFGSDDKNTYDLRQYLTGEGITIEQGVLAQATDVIGGVGSFIGRGAKFGQVMGMALGIILVGGVGMIIYQMTKSPENITRSVAAIGTKGKSEMIGV